MYLVLVENSSAEDGLSSVEMMFYNSFVSSILVVSHHSYNLEVLVKYHIVLYESFMLV